MRRNIRMAYSGVKCYLAPMSDLVIRQSEGWEELEDVLVVVGDDLWAAAGQQDLQEAEDALDRRGFELAEDETLAGIRVVAVPDDFQGQIVRVWIRTDGG